MEKYNAWIKELSTIVYDNSKSEYQILSELIPILLNIKSSQDTNSELMDTIHETVFNKVNELESGMNTFSETFTQKLNEFKQEFNSGVEEFTTTLESNINEFKEKINNKIITFNKTYASEKASIQDIADSINNINDTLISGYNEIIEKINNFVEPIINSASGNIIDNAIEEKFTPTYLARESIYIDLVSVTTAPSSANEGDIYYNASEYQLYKYTGSAWVEENYTTNKIYRFKNNIYYLNMYRTNIETIFDYGLNGACFIDENHVLAYSSNVGLRMQFVIIDIANKTRENHSMVTPPEGYTRTSAFYYLQCIDNKYYFQYYNNNVYNLAISDDLENWTYLCPLTMYGNHGKLKKINNYLVYGGRYYYDEESNTFKDFSQFVYGYYNNKYYIVSSDEIIISNQPIYQGQQIIKRIPIPEYDVTNDKNRNFYLFKDKLIVGGYILNNNDELVCLLTPKKIIFNNNLSIGFSTLYSFINNGIIYNMPINIGESFLQYYDINSDINTNIIVNTFDTSTSSTSVLKFDLSIGLVAYE